MKPANWAVVAFALLSAVACGDPQSKAESVLMETVARFGYQGDLRYAGLPLGAVVAKRAGGAFEVICLTDCRPEGSDILMAGISGPFYKGFWAGYNPWRLVVDNLSMTQLADTDILSASQSNPPTGPQASTGRWQRYVDGFRCAGRSGASRSWSLRNAVFREGVLGVRLDRYLAELLLWKEGGTEQERAAPP